MTIILAYHLYKVLCVQGDNGHVYSAYLLPGMDSGGKVNSLGGNNVNHCEKGILV